MTMQEQASLHHVTLNLKSKDGAASTGKAHAPRMVINDHVAEHFRSATEKFKTTIDSGYDTLDFDSFAELNDQGFDDLELSRVFVKAARDAANGHVNPAVVVKRICDENDAVYRLQVISFLLSLSPSRSISLSLSAFL